MKLSTFRYEIADQIAVVTLDRPPVNALDSVARRELTDIFDDISDRTDVRVAILTAKGRLFCAGADIKERAGMPKEAGDYLRHNRKVRDAVWAIMDCSKPVIAAVNGPAIGAGFALMLACDIMLAAETATFSMPEIDVGLSGGQRLLLEHFGRSAARRLFYTGATITASELWRRGIIEDMVASERLLAEAIALAETIASKSPIGIASAKRSFNIVEHLPYRLAYPYEQSVTKELSSAEDTIEAQRAFVEKRKPVFKGG